MTPKEHAKHAKIFLEQSDKEFASGDILQGSEKLWGATAQALMASEGQKGRPAPGKHVKMIAVVDQHYPELRTSFAVARAFHSNFYHDFMEDADIRQQRPLIHDLVNQLLNGSN